MGGGEDYIFIVDVGDIEEEPTACKKFDLVVDDFLERELDDPVVYNIQVCIFGAGVFVVVAIVVRVLVFLERFLTSPIRVLP